jgi:hypothetical protein
MPVYQLPVVLTLNVLAVGSLALIFSRPTEGKIQLREGDNVEIPYDPFDVTTLEDIINIGAVLFWKRVRYLPGLVIIAH